MRRLFSDPGLQASFEREILEPVLRHQERFRWSGADAPRVPALSYVVCATPRSGSSLLCEALRLSGVAGVPQEYFLYGLGEIATPAGGVAAPDLVSFSEYADEMVRLGTASNGVFGLKVMQSYFNGLVRHLAALDPRPDASPALVLARHLPNLRYVHISRANKIRQAVSLAKAVQSSRWKSYQQPTRTTLVYDGDQIASFLSMIVRHERAWSLFFEDAEIRPWEVVYEKLADAFGQTARDTLAALGLPQPEAHVFERRELASLTDRINDEWAERFTTEAPRRFEDPRPADWEIETHGETDAQLEHSRGEPGRMRVTISRLTDRVPWHVKVKRARFRIAGGNRYVLSLRARADTPRRIYCGVGQDSEPWAALGAYAALEVTTDWNAFEYRFDATAGEPNARIFFDLGDSAAVVELSNIVLYNVTTAREELPH